MLRATGLVRVRAREWVFITPEPVCALSPSAHGFWKLQGLTIGGLLYHLLSQPIYPVSHLGLSFPIPALYGIDNTEGLRLCPWVHPFCWSCCLSKSLGLPPELRAFTVWPSPLANLFFLRPNPPSWLGQCPESSGHALLTSLQPG